MIEWIIVGVFSVWFLLSCFVHVPRIGPIIRSLDPFYFLPDFKFFAPTPAQQDFHILYRDRFPNGSVTDWTEIEPLRQRRPWHVVWNEGKRGSKARLDLAVTLAGHLVNQDTEIRLSIPYLMLLNHISGIPRPIPPDSTQFLLMQSVGRHREHEHESMFLSDLHPL